MKNNFCYVNIFIVRGEYMKKLFLLFIIFFLFSKFVISQNNLSGLREKRVALVIGNASYKRYPLKNTVHDAVDMCDALQSKGFEVIRRSNTDYKKMWDAIREFGERLRNSDVGLFYYSGHGVQVNGINYLIPINSGIISEDETRFKAIDASLVLEKMKSAGNSMNIVILDACRVNPYKKVRGGIGGGLAKMDAPSGSIIIYSTGPGQTASDGTGRNGIFTKYFLRSVLSDDLEIGMLLRKVRKNIIKETNGKQIPWESSSLTGEFWFSKAYGNGSFKPIEKISNEPLSVEFTRMTFFESGSEYDDLSKRKYGDSFYKKKCRYINTKLVFRNKLYSVKDSKLNIRLKFFKPDGSYWNSITKKIKVGKDLDYASYERLGFGWSDPGNWKPGTYKVKVYFNEIYVAQSEFSILPDGFSEKGGFKYKSVRFFEAAFDYDGSEKVEYSTRFEKSKTRTIYSYILFINKLYNLKDQKIKMKVIIYKPSGASWGNIERNISVSRNLDLASYDKAGWGWKTAGNWETGTYKVEIFFNDKKVGKSEFEIY